MSEITMCVHVCVREDMCLLLPINHGARCGWRGSLRRGTNLLDIFTPFAQDTWYNV